MRYHRLLLSALLAACSLLGQSATAGVMPSSDTTAFVAPAGSTKFMNLPFLPRCMMGSIKQGDPRIGPSVVLARIASGCVIPWHWHSANTRLIFLSGYGTHTMKGTNASTDVRAGDFIYLPARQAHFFRCISTCIAYNISDRRDVVHWIDKNGHDITLKQATGLRR